MRLRPSSVLRDWRAAGTAVALLFPMGLRTRLAERHIGIDLTDAAVEYLVKVGYDPTFGARPLKRAIQKEVETPLARRLVAGEIRDGQKVRVDLGDDHELRFEIESIAHAEAS